MDTAKSNSTALTISFCEKLLINFGVSTNVYFQITNLTGIKNF